jgi:hypothetical protein
MESVRYPDGGTWYPSLQVPEPKTSHPFPFGEKPDRKNDAVHQGQNRKFR